MLELTNEEYHKDTSRISKSGLDWINKSPLHYWEKYLNPDREVEEKTDALVFGDALHCSILENELFRSKFVVAPQVDRRTKEGKKQYEEFIQEHEGKTLLSSDDFEKCLRMSDAVLNHKTASVLLKEGFTEKTIFFEEPFENVKCKMRPDFYNTRFNCIVDLKTTEDASPQAFGRSSLKYRYHVQSAFYTDGIWYSDTANPKSFIFIAIEKKPPYAIGIYEVPENVLAFGRATYLKDLNTYAKCLETGIWHGYGDKIQNLDFPVYAMRNL